MEVSTHTSHHLQLTPTYVRIFTYRSCSPLDVHGKDKGSCQLSLLSCAFWKEIVLLPPRLPERGGSGTQLLIFFACSHVCALAVKEYSNICCVLLFLFCFSTQAGDYINRESS